MIKFINPLGCAVGQLLDNNMSTSAILQIAELPRRGSVVAWGPLLSVFIERSIRIEGSVLIEPVRFQALLNVQS